MSVNYLIKYISSNKGANSNYIIDNIDILNGEIPNGDEDDSYSFYTNKINDYYRGPNFSSEINGILLCYCDRLSKGNKIVFSVHYHNGSSFYMYYNTDLGTLKLIENIGLNTIINDFDINNDEYACQTYSNTIVINNKEIIFLYLGTYKDSKKFKCKINLSTNALVIIDYTTMVESSYGDEIIREISNNRILLNNGTILKNKNMPNDIRNQLVDMSNYLKILGAMISGKTYRLSKFHL